MERLPLTDASHVRQDAGAVIYVVDYDLPRGNRRRRFYRAVARYRREHLLEETGWSTWSVVFTEDLDFAWLVYREALKVGGKAQVWRAERLYDEP